jgi:CheY-like chemotaxis protein
MKTTSPPYLTADAGPVWSAFPALIPAPHNDSEPAGSGPEESSLPRAALRPRVLLADDDPAIVELTALLLHFAGFEVTTAVDGEDAWRTYLEHGCDLLLTDHHMPRLSGIELIARVRTHGDPLPVILASGRLEPDDIPYTLRDQITAFLAKPFPNTVLVETIRRCLGQTVA